MTAPDWFPNGPHRIRRSTTWAVRAFPLWANTRDEMVMKSLSRTAVATCASALFLAFSACAGTDDTTTSRGATIAAGGGLHGSTTTVRTLEGLPTGPQDGFDQRFGEGVGASYRVSDVTPEYWSGQNYERFIQLRCLELGGGLAKFDHPTPAVRELARNDVLDILKRDQRTIDAWYAQGREPSGLVVPRRIANELRKSLDQQDNAWLARQGRLLKAVYQMESFEEAKWTTAAEAMMKEGPEGREFLAAQLVKRLANGTLTIVDRAQEMLVEYVPKEAASMLVAATYVDIPANMGVFPRRTAETLARLGPTALPAVSAEWFDKNGKFLRTDDTNWKTRRFLCEALGGIAEIGGESATKASAILLRDLKEHSISNDDSRFVFRTYLLEAIGNTRDKEAIDPLLAMWKANITDESLVARCRNALLRITGELWSAPDRKAARTTG